MCSGAMNVIFSIFFCLSSKHPFHTSIPTVAPTAPRSQSARFVTTFDERSALHSSPVTEGGLHFGSQSDLSPSLFSASGQDKIQ